MSKCIFCGATLNESNSADEHVIPNALGGRLTTRAVTCASCNSDRANVLDLALTRPLAPYGNMLNLPRDRGRHPDIEFTSGESTFVLKSGQPPRHAANLEVEKSDQRIHVNVDAATREEAWRRLKKLTKQTVITADDLIPTVKPAEPYEFATESFDMCDESVLRAICKIALAFARQRGVDTDDADAAQQYLKSQTASQPVNRLYREVVELEEADTDIAHCILLFSTDTGSPLYCYVCLFGALEYLVLIRERQYQTISEGYYYELRYAQPQARRWRLLASAEGLHTALSEAGSNDRLLERSARLTQAINRQADLPHMRATSRAMAEAARVLFRSNDKEAARAAAQKYMDDAGQRSGWNYNIQVDVKDES